MTGERLLLDTVFIQALLNRRDQYHRHARTFLPRMRSAAEVWVTEAVLIEVGNALSAFNRMAAVTFIQQCYQADNVEVVSVDTALFNQAIELNQARPDKAWGMTACISFVVMQQQGLTDAVTAVEHFSQAGYRTLLLEEA